MELNKIYNDNLKTLNKAFDFMNKKLFSGALSKTVITIQADTKQKAYGWFTAYDSWQAGEQKTQEINLSANYLDRDAFETLGTLLHEMIHQYCHENKIQDTSRSGVYHNAKFADACEAHGLHCEKNGKNGFTSTKLKDETKELLKDLASALTSVKRIVPKGLGKKSSTRKYTCPNGCYTVRATKDVHIICGECNKKMRKDGETDDTDEDDNETCDEPCGASTVYGCQDCPNGVYEDTDGEEDGE